MSFQQMQQESPILKYPEDFGLHPNVSLETAANMLLRAISTSQNLPYNWTFIDKPQEGQIYLLFMPNPSQPLNDGIRWQDQENRYNMPVQRGTRELEVTEVKFGFIPNSQDTAAWRMRRRYRLHKGGHPQLVLVHYSRVPPIQIIPSLLNNPIRHYPLRQITDPPIYVMGDKMGQKAFPGAHPVGPHQGQGQGGMSHQGQGGMPQQAMVGMPQQGMGMGQQGMVGMGQQGMGMGQQGMVGMGQQGMGMGQQGMSMGQQGMVGMPQQGMGMPQGMVGMSPQGMVGMTPQAMIAQQNNNMEALERRRERERPRDGSAGVGVGQRPGPPRLDDDESADESELLSTRTLAIARYRRNHELMEEVFRQAAFGNNKPPPPKSIYENFNKTELETKVARLQNEVKALQTRADERRAQKVAADDVVVTASGHALMDMVI